VSETTNSRARTITSLSTAASASPASRFAIWPDDLDPLHSEANGALCPLYATAHRLLAADVSTFFTRPFGPVERARDAGVLRTATDRNSGAAAGRIERALDRAAGQRASTQPQCLAAQALKVDAVALLAGLHDTVSAARVRGALRGIERTVWRARQRSCSKAEGVAVEALQVVLVALLARLHQAVSTVGKLPDTAAGIEQACVGARELALTQAQAFAREPKQVDAVALLGEVDRPVATGIGDITAL